MFFLLAAVVFCAAGVREQPAKIGVPVSFQLPVTEPLPQTYRVTLAIVDAKNPDWIISQFTSGVACTVTQENGGPGAERFKYDPNGNIPGTNKEMKAAVREFYEAATYPPDSGKVDKQEVFKGEMIRGYWRDPREVRWKAASVADLDTRVVLGGAEVWYDATWIHVPAATELEFQFQSHTMTHLRWTLNGEPGKVGEYKDVAGGRRRVATKNLT